MKTLSKHHIEALEKAKTELGKVNAAALAMIETRMDLIKTVLLKHEVAFLEVMWQQQADEALLRQALEALERSETTVPYEGFGISQREAIRKHAEAIAALRERLGETK